MAGDRSASGGSGDRVVDRRLALLRAALGFLQVQGRAPELTLLHRWLDSWNGIGPLAVGMYRLGYRVSLSHIAEGEWRATFGTHALFASAGVRSGAYTVASGSGCSVVS